LLKEPRRRHSEAEDDVGELAKTGRLLGVRLKKSQNPDKWDYIVLSNQRQTHRKKTTGTEYLKDYTVKQETRVER